MPGSVRAVGRSTSGYGSVRTPPLCVYPTLAKNPPRSFVLPRERDDTNPSFQLRSWHVPHASGGERAGPRPRSQCCSPTRASTNPPSIAPSLRPPPTHPAASTSREHPPHDEHHARHRVLRRCYLPRRPRRRTVRRCPPGGGAGAPPARPRCRAATRGTTQVRGFTGSHREIARRHRGHRGSPASTFPGDVAGD